MQSADGIKELFKKAELAVHPDADEQVFQDVLRAHNETKTDKPDEHATLCLRRGEPAPAQAGASVGMAPGLWRITMRSPITKLAIAAVLVIACLMGVMMWRGTGSSVALASVLTQLQQINGYMYQMTVTITGQKVGDRTINQNMYSTILVSRDGAMKMTMNMVDPNGIQKGVQEMYLLPQRKTMLTIVGDAKQYMEIEMDDARLQNEQKRNNDPRVMVELLMNCNYVSLGRSTIDGVQVDGFETTDPKYMGAVLGQTDVKMWIDAKTLLPVRSEMDLQNDQMHMHYVEDQFQWDVSMDPKEFEPVIPADYTAMSSAPMKVPPMTEETLIQGLKLFAEMAGRYPDELNLMGISAKLGELSAKELMKDANRPGLSKAEKLQRLVQPNKEAMQKLTDKMMPMAATAAFYATLVQGNKDPAYYGKTVTPQDADKVLMRWKVSDDEYRVIFGNLNAVTVKADVLAEMEKALPK